MQGDTQIAIDGCLGAFCDVSVTSKAMDNILVVQKRTVPKLMLQCVILQGTSVYHKSCSRV